MNPASLPMPETFKEPGYPYAIAGLTPLARDPFRAAQGVSLLTGVLLPFAVYRLGRRLARRPLVGWAAAALAAASPLLIHLSVWVMAESALTLALTLALLAAAPRAGEDGGLAPPALAGPLDFVSGILFGLAFLIRAQAALAAPALAALLCAGAALRVRLGRLALGSLGA